MTKGFLNFDRFKKTGEKLVDKAQTVSLPFFDGIPIYDVTLFFWRSIVNGSITTRASAIAFSFFVAFFPFTIFLFTLIPVIPIENFQNELFSLVKQVVPTSAFSTIEGTIEVILNQPRGDLLSFGFFMALVFSTNGLVAMMNAFDATIHSIKKRKWWDQRLVAILLLLILSVLLTIAIALLTGGQKFIEYLDYKKILRDTFTIYLLTFGKWVTIITLFFFAYSFLYYMAPAKKVKWRFISAGGTLATILSIIAIAVFTYYINHFGRYNILYGSLGTLLIILLLIYVMSLILLVGFELNASIYQAHTEREEEMTRR